MITRSLSRRLERLETRCALIRDPLVININFIAPDGRIAKQLRFTCGDDTAPVPGGASSSPWDGHSDPPVNVSIGVASVTEQLLENPENRHSCGSSKTGVHR